MTNNVAAKERAWVTYALSDPRRPNDIRYIGVTHTTVKKRLGRHIGSARSGKKTHHSARWLRSLLHVGATPQTTVVEEGVGAGWAAAEACANMNASKASPEYRAKMSRLPKAGYADRKARGVIKSQIGKKMSKESRAKMSLTAKVRHERARQVKKDGRGA